MAAKEKQVKKIGMQQFGWLLAWIFGLFIIFLGIVLFWRGIQQGVLAQVTISAILFILSGFFVLPLCNYLLTKLFKIQLSGWIRFIIFIILMILAVILFYTFMQPYTQA